MNRLRSFAIAFLASLFVSASAHDLTEADRNKFAKRVKDQVEEFQGYLSTISDTDEKMDHRQTAMKSALLLFIGNGEPYVVEDGSGRVENQRPVRMHISEVSQGTRIWQLMGKYLSGQLNNHHKYTQLRIESADAVIVDNIYKVGEGKYECMATFYQRFFRLRNSS